jgi:hypothetical protein
LIAVALLVPWATQAMPRWVPLAPEPVHGTILDTRHRRLVAGSVTWSLAGEPTPSWTPVPDVQLGGVYDPKRNRLWAFQFPFNVYPAKLLVFDLDSPELGWQQFPFAGNPPYDLNASAVALDPIRDRILFFGGYAGMVAVAGVFVLDLNGAGGTPTWVSPAIAGVGPTPRANSSALYDPFRDRMLLYGGNDDGGTHIFDETWSLSLGSPMAWTFLVPQSAVAYARTEASAVLDSLGQRMIVMGGIGPGGGPSPDPSRAYNDMWELDLSATVPADSAVWHPLPAAPVSPGVFGVSWVDTATNRLLRLGGPSLWALPLSGNHPTWTALVPDSLPLPTRYSHAALLDPVRDEWVTGLGSPGDLWGHGLSSDKPWSLLPVTGGPGTRLGAGIARDEEGGRTLAFGGRNGSDPPALFSDLWALGDGASAWTPVSPASTPSPRAEALTLFDSARRRLIVHGGWYTSLGRTRVRADTWAYDVASNTWQSLDAVGYGGRWGETGIHDPVRDRIVAFGGVDTLSGYADTHVLSLASGTWSNLPTSGTPPAAVRGQTFRAAYDPEGDRMLVVAAADTSLRVYALSLGASPTWSVVDVDGPPPPTRQNFAAGYDAAGKRWLVTGGGDPSGAARDAWVLYLDPDASVDAQPATQEFATDHLHVVWQERGAPVPQFSAYRRSGGSDWQALATIVPNGDRQVVLDDFAVHPDSTYDYRVGAIVGGSERFFGAVTVTSTAGRPPVSGQGLRLAARPNPVTDALDLQFTLQSPAPVRVELLDLSGRRVFDRSLGTLESGDHVFRLAPRGALRPGLYFARLTEGASHLVTKVVVAP